MKNILFILFLFAQLATQAQGYDRYMSEVRSLLASKDYLAADSIIDNALLDFPKDHDMLCTRARIYAWQGNLQKADTVVQRILTYYSNDLEAYKISATLSYWSEDYEKLLFQAEEYLSYYPDDADLKYYQAYAYYHHGSVKKSAKLIDDLLALHADHQAALKLQKVIRSTYYNFADAELTYARFDANLSPWYQVRLGYGSKKKLPWSIHALAVERFNRKGYGLEVDAYPRLGKKTYAFLEMSASPQPFMAKYTAGLEITQSLQAVEVSLGSKRFHFENHAFFLHKAGIGIYQKKYSARYQFFVSEQLQTINLTHILRMKAFLGSIHSIEGELVTGTNAVEYVDPEGRATILENRSAGLKYLIDQEKSTWFVRLRVRSEEYRSELFRTRLDFQLGITSKIH